MFDFHSLAFVVPSAMWAVYLLDTGGFKRYWLVIALMLITREDISLLNCFVGAYAIMIGRTRTGLVTVAVSMVYLVLVKMYAMADSGLLMSADKAYSYVYYYAEMILSRYTSTGFGSRSRSLGVGGVLPSRTRTRSRAGTQVMRWPS